MSAIHSTATLLAVSLENNAGGAGVRRPAAMIAGELHRGCRRPVVRAVRREQLRAAHETFSRIGAEAFAERARRELAASGETVRKRADETRDVLTAQEAQIARLARDEQGGEVLEYALVAGLIVVAAIAVIGSVGTKVLARWTSLKAGK